MSGVFNTNFGGMFTCILDSIYFNIFTLENKEKFIASKEPWYFEYQIYSDETQTGLHLASVFRQDFQGKDNETNMSLWLKDPLEMYLRR